MMSMMLYDNYVTRFGMEKTAAGVEVGLVLGVSDKTPTMASSLKALHPEPLQAIID